MIVNWVGCSIIFLFYNPLQSSTIFPEYVLLCSLVTLQVLDACRLQQPVRRREMSWGHPRPWQEDCVPLHPCSRAMLITENAISSWHKQYTRIHMLMSIVVLNRLGQGLLYTPGCG